MNAPVLVETNGETDPLEVCVAAHLRPHDALSSCSIFCDADSLAHCNARHSGGLQIASMELREQKIPFIIRRYLPDGR